MLNEYYKGMEPEFKTFAVWSRDPNKPTEEGDAGCALIVTDLLAVIQRDAAMWFASGDAQWPENVPPREWWFQLLIDKGGGSTKVLLKHVCMHRADTVRRCTVVGILDKILDRIPTRTCCLHLVNCLPNSTRSIGQQRLASLAAEFHSDIELCFH